MRTKTNGKWSVQKLIYTGMLAALAGVLMSLEFSVPLMPPFYKICRILAAMVCSAGHAAGYSGNHQIFPSSVQ